MSSALSDIVLLEYTIAQRSKLAQGHFSADLRGLGADLSTARRGGGEARSGSRQENRHYEEYKPQVDKAHDQARRSEKLIARKILRGNERAKRMRELREMTE